MTGDPATWRIRTFLIAIALAGSGVFAVARGWRSGLGFLLGAGVSYASFERWHAMVHSLGAASGRGAAWRSTARLLLLALAVYVIVKYLEVNRMAALAGLGAAAAAVILEILYELIYGT